MLETIGYLLLWLYSLFCFLIILDLYWELIFWLNFNNSSHFLKINYDESKWWRLRKIGSFPSFFEIFSDLLRCLILFKNNKINYIFSIILIIIMCKFFKVLIVLFLLGFGYGMFKKIYAYIVSYNKKITIYYTFKKNCLLVFNIGEAYSNIFTYLLVNKYFKLNKDVFLFNRFVNIIVGLPYYVLDYIFTLSEIVKKIISYTNWNEKSKAYWMSIFLYDVKKANELLLNIKINNFKKELTTKKIIFKNLTVNLNPNNYNELLRHLFRCELLKRHNWTLLSKLIGPDQNQNLYSFESHNIMHAAFGWTKIDANKKYSYYAVHSSKPEIPLHIKKDQLLNMNLDIDFQNLSFDQSGRANYISSTRFDNCPFNSKPQEKYMLFSGIENDKIIQTPCKDVITKYCGIVSWDQINDVNITFYKKNCAETTSNQLQLNEKKIILQPIQKFDQTNLMGMEEFQENYIDPNFLTCLTQEIPNLIAHEKELIKLNEISELYDYYIESNPAIQERIKYHKIVLNKENFLWYIGGANIIETAKNETITQIANLNFGDNLDDLEVWNEYEAAANERLEFFFNSSLTF